jgi:hypothetical protein
MIDPDDYDDPELNDWVLPSLPNPALVPDNTHCFGPLYIWRGEPRSEQAWISIAVTREITAPWRRGLGVTFRKTRRPCIKAVAVGIWLRGRPPAVLSQPPEEKDWRETVTRSFQLGTVPPHDFVEAPASLARTEGK